MARLVPAQCPNCGAHVKLDPALEYVTCSYCNVHSFIERRGRHAPPNVPVVHVKSGMHPALGILLLLGLLVMGLGLIAVVYVIKGRTSSAQASVPMAADRNESSDGPDGRTSGTQAVAAAAETETAFTVEGRALLGPANADDRDDVVVRIRQERARNERFAAFDGATGERLWSGPELESTSSALSALVGRRLIFASDTGQLVGYHSKDGAEQWTTTLGDKVRELCRADSADAVRVRTLDERVVDVDTSTGKQTERTKSSTCIRLATDGRTHHRMDPRDRTDPQAPSEIESTVCGSVRVMGSANYTISDPCPAKGASSKILDGLAPSAVWSLEKGLLVRGSKTPGTRVAMLGFIKSGRMAWKQEVPDGNPLEYAEGAPNVLAVSEDAVFAALSKRDHSKHYVSAFSLRDGKRLWQIELQERDQVDRLTFNGGIVFVERDDFLLALDGATGKRRYTLGVPR